MCICESIMKELFYFIKISMAQNKLGLISWECIYVYEDKIR